jgi:hypothetical protein
MFKRVTITGLLVGGALLAYLATASAYTYTRPAGQDCGKAVFAGGFGGPRPTNVPANAQPQLDTFIVHGRISCAKAKKVMAAFEKSFNTGTGGSKGVSPAGWKCEFSKKLRGNECTNSARVTISNGIVYKVP